MPRYREFELDEALANIKSVFWEQGYEGASMALIEKATQLKKQSLYRAFGDKREMYLAALRDYDRKEVAAAIKLLKVPGTPQQQVDGLLTAIIDSAISSGDRRGCLLCNSAVDQAPLNERSAELIDKIMQRFEQAIEDCLAQAMPFKTDEKHRKSTACALLSGYFGVRVMIKANMPRSMLDAARERMVSGLL